MRRTVLYCDRKDCAPEEHPARYVVWIRTGGLGRAVKQDVCERAHALILGTANGAAPPTPAHEERPRLKGGLFMPGSAGEKDAAKIRALLAKQSPRTLDQILLAVGDADKHRVGRVLTTLTRAGELTSGPLGVYYCTGAPRPPKPVDELAATRAVLELVRREPGIRSVFVGPLLGYGHTVELKKLLRELVRAGGLRSKGTKSAMRYFPGKPKR